MTLSDYIGQEHAKGERLAKQLLELVELQQASQEHSRALLDTVERQLQLLSELDSVLRSKGGRR